MQSSNPTPGAKPIEKIENSIALVTGANRGIGKAIVEELLARGASKVYAGVRNTDAAQPWNARIRAAITVSPGWWPSARQLASC